MRPIPKAIYSRRAFAVIIVFFVMISCQKNIDKTSAGNEVTSVLKDPRSLKDFEQVNLVGDNNEYNPAHIDPNLVNGWGITFPSSGPAWVSAEGTGKSVIY